MKDETPPAFEFKKMSEPPVGCGYSKFWSFQIRSHGRELFKAAVQSLPEDLMADPWEDGWGDGPEEEEQDDERDR